LSDLPPKASLFFFSPHGLLSGRSVLRTIKKLSAEYAFRVS